ncbi:centrosomal protein of 63 kDa [Corythoichthys intestinalis]|uniref:centrosomal protein of 63 kDa n=1 Tax=Corythoichthys intestinalis TaxID=161448 RepID=UPI0025A62FCB|nr:centrosomal protein of 63 kDa [Corythoichthys intestinalis]XP_057696444.1 centrosomal protein of 63 kDa [Corythoichthys intestinalis]
MEACMGTLLNSDLGSVLSACEPELQELMRQIDIMMSQQRSEYEAQVRDLQQRLMSEQEEMNSSRVLLQRKDLEIGVLRKQLQELQAGRQDQATKYEKQLGIVSEELEKLKRSYQKLERRRMRKPLNEESKSKKEDPSEVRMLRDNLEECKQKLVVYQQHLAELEAQKKSLSDELTHVKAQRTSEVQHATCCSDVQRLRAQLEKVHHNLHTQEVELGRLRALEDNRMAHEGRELQDKEEQIARLHNDISTIKHMLHDKDQVVRSLEECADKLRGDLARTSADFDCARASEAYLNGEVIKLKERLQEINVQHAKLQQEHKVLQEAFDTSVADAKKLRGELSRAEQRHSEEIEAMRKQAEMAPLGESCVTGQDCAQLRPQTAATKRPGSAPHDLAGGDQSNAAAESETTSYDGDIQRLFTQLLSSGSHQPSDDDSALTERTPEGCDSVSPPRATVSRFLEEENLRTKELLHKLDTHILSMGDGNAATIAKRLLKKSS